MVRAVPGAIPVPDDITSGAECQYAVFSLGVILPYAVQI